MKATRAFLLLTLMGLVRCGVGSTPTAPVSTATPTPEIITEAEAVSQAMEDAREWIPGLTPVDNPRNPIARRMTVGEYRDMLGWSDTVMFGLDELIWVVQLEGYSQSEGPPPTSRIKAYSHAIFAYDAETGAIADGGWATRRKAALFFPE